PSLSTDLLVRSAQVHLRGAEQDLFQLPRLGLRQWTALDDRYAITYPSFSGLVVRVELLPLTHDAAVQRMRNASFDLNNDRLLHLGRDHLADLGLLMRFVLFTHLDLRLRPRS